LPKKSPLDARRDRLQVASVARELMPGALPAQVPKGTKARSTKKVRHVCYLPPDLSRWVKEEAFRRSKPGALFAETDLFEEAIRCLIVKAGGL
jgi:hypothetical protein